MDEVEWLRRRVAELDALVEKLTQTVEQQAKTIEKLTSALDEARRAGKRQAAPFRQGPPQAEPKLPGRKPGDQYGQQFRRAVPSDEEIDETYDVPLPSVCPHCGSRHLHETHVAYQYQIELPAKPIQRRFDVHVGCCGECSQRVQGRHGLQTSDALGAAAVQLGANAHAAITWLNKSLGVPHGKIAKLFRHLFAILINRSTSARSVARTAAKCEPAYQEIRASIRGSPIVRPDETGWRIGGQNAWNHVFVGQHATLFEIACSRGFDIASDALGADYSGVLVHDGWAVYDRFTQATHQQCVAHVLRRAHELLEVATRGAVKFPRAVIQLFQQALLAREEFRKRKLTRRRLREQADEFSLRLHLLTCFRRTNPDHERFAKHLCRHAAEFFTFLRLANVEATNYRAEQAIRPSVVNRKVWGGNRTDNGARHQAILTSVLVTCDQLQRNPLNFLAQSLRDTRPPRLLADTR
jgi:transposase